MAHRAGLIHQLQVRGKIALRIVGAPVKYIAALGLAYRQVAAVLGTFHVQQLLLDVLALGVAGARNKFPIASIPLQQRFAALRAGLIQLHVIALTSIGKWKECSTFFSTAFGSFFHGPAAITSGFARENALHA